MGCEDFSLETETAIELAAHNKVRLDLETQRTSILSSKCRLLESVNNASTEGRKTSLRWQIAKLDARLKRLLLVSIPPQHMTRAVEEIGRSVKKMSKQKTHRKETRAT